MTQRQIKLVENYIRNVVRKTLNEVDVNEKPLLDLNEELKSLKSRGADASVINRYKTWFNKFKVGDVADFYDFYTAREKWQCKITKIENNVIYGIKIKKIK